MPNLKDKRTCEKNHIFYKSSDCYTCPVCERERRPEDGFLSGLPAPARRALENNGIITLEQLADYTEAEILKLHGMGKTTLPKLYDALSEKGLSLKTEK
ncbi:MAG: RNA polymerase alpha subunit C-terminal domain-containing protein [Bacteroidota bacterium]